MKLAFAAGAAMSVALALPAAATTVSPTTAGALPGTVTVVGGIVVDMIGANDARVVAQLAASNLFVGFSDDGDPVGFRGNPLTVGIQTGFGPGVTGALGGGLKEIAVRFTLFDGDTAPGDFDDGDNTLLVNGVNLGDWTAVPTTQTTGTGTPLSSGFGFGDNILSTGFFYSNNAGALASIFSSIEATDQIVYQLNDVDPTDNFFDFTQGIDAGLIDVETPPDVVDPGTNAVPIPAAAPLLGLGLLSFAALRRMRRRA